MAKKKDNKTMWIIVALIIFAYGGGQGWFKSDVTINSTTQGQLNSPPSTTETCSVSISPSVITAGDSVTGTLLASPRVFCETYAKYGGVWAKVWEGNTDINGRVSATETMNLVGDYIFKAICGSCITNEATLVVNPTAASPDCTDTDGKNKMTPGHVTYDGVSYYDDCAGNWAVKEFWCNGDILTESIIACDPGYICTETRSGDYCGSTDYGYEVGDVIGTGSVGNDIFGVGGQSNLVDLSGTESLGDCYLGIKINTDWGYITPNECNGIIGPQVLEWLFYDSNGLRWSRVDTTPVALGVDICPASWDGQSPWSITATTLHPYANCDIGYDLDWEVYVCEC